VLLTDAALSKIITGYEKRIATLALNLERAKREAAAFKKTSKVVCDARVAAEHAKTSACDRDLSRQKSIYEKALKRTNRATPWYKSPYLSFMIGNVVAGGICVAATRVK
jgi:hypothetical protein